MSDPRQIKYSATVDDNPFAAGMQRIGAALSGVQQRMSGTGRDWGNVTAGMSAQIGKVAESVRDSVAGMGGHFGALLSGLGRTSAGMLGLVAAGAALAASKAVNATAHHTEATMDLARALGTSTNEASVWRTALEDVGAEEGELAAAAKGMSRQLRENEKDLQAMGLATRDSSGHLRPMNDLLVDGLAILNRHKEGADRALAGQVLFGRGVDASSKLLLVNADALEEARQANEDLGLEVGGRATAAWKAWDAATDRAGFSVKGLVLTIGNLLMPVMTDLVTLFNAVMPAAITVVRGALGGLVTAFEAVRNGAVVVWEVVTAMVVTVAAPIRALGLAIGRALIGDFSGAAAAMRGIGSNISAAWAGAMDNMAASSERARARIGAIWSGGAGGIGEAPGDRGRDDFKRPPDGNTKSKTKKSAEESRVPGWEAELAEAKVSLAEEARLRGEFREMQQVDEAAYWEALLARTDLSEKERVAIRRKAAELNLSIDKAEFEARLQTMKNEREELEKNYAARADVAQRAYQETVARYGAESQEAKKAYAEVLAEQRRFVAQQRQIELLAADARREQRLAEVEIDRLVMQEQLALGIVSREQALAAEREFEQRVFQSRLQGLQERLGLIDPQRDPVAYAQASAQIEQLELQHQQRLAQIAQQMRLESIAPVANTLNSIQGAWEGLIANLMKGTLTIGGFVRGMFQSVVDSVNQALARMAAEWMARQIAMRLFGVADSVGTITRKAGEAGAGGVASMAAAPFPISLGAPAFGAAMAAAAMGFGSLASARAGFDVPFGVNPLTQLHEREMVLPAAQADVIRGLAGGGNAPGPQASPTYSVTQHNTFTVQGSVDRRTQEQIAAAAYRGLARAIERGG